MNKRIVRRVCFAALCGAVIHRSAVAQVVASDRTVTAASASEVMGRLVNADFDRVSVETAVKRLAASAQVRVTYRAAQLDVVSAPVTLHVKRISLGDALEQVLKGTGLRAEAVTADGIGIRQVGAGATVVAQGGVVGKVTDSQTKQPLRGATVRLDDDKRGVSTDEAGQYRFSGVTPGTHQMTVRMVGYVKHVHSITVSEGQSITADVALEPSVNALDQVVVTGTVVATELKAVPNAITIVTAKDIERRGITRIDQLFRGDIPGLFVQNSGDPLHKLGQVTMFSRGATALGSSLGTTNSTNPIKTYVDGVEMSDPSYLSQIDPSTIERIEILTGPQASTIYGSNALNGVMQIFTKRGSTSRPQVTLNAQTGAIQTNIASSFTPQHLVNGNVSGIEGRMAYFANASWNYTGQWRPGDQSTVSNGSTGLRWTVGPRDALAVDATFQLSKTQQFDRGVSVGRSMESGWYRRAAVPGAAQTSRYILDGQTYGLNGTYRMLSGWSHAFNVGRDSRNTYNRAGGRRQRDPSDTTIYQDAVYNERFSLGYNTTVQGNPMSWLSATVTAGGDGWRTQASTNSVTAEALTGRLAGSVYMSRQTSHNTGAFLTSQIGLGDQLFLTYGLRAEWNPNFGDEATPNWAPRYGVAYTAEFGPLTAKLRGSYGRSTRPPNATDKLPSQQLSQAWWTSGDIPIWGDIYQVTGNPLLEPERQQGAEFGVEVYMGSLASLRVTRYNQTVNNLIAAIPGVDSVKSIVAYPHEKGVSFYSCADYLIFNNRERCSSQTADGYWYRWISENVNVAGIRNQGLELQGTLVIGPFSTHGTYSWTKSRSLGVTEKFRKQFAVKVGNLPQYAPGATPMYVAEHTWALGTTYATARGSVGIDITGVGQLLNANGDLQVKYLSDDVRLRANEWRQNIPPIGYYTFGSKGYATADLTATYRVSSRIEGRLKVQNLTDFYQNDLDSRYPVMGRRTWMGFTVRY